MKDHSPKAMLAESLVSHRPIHGYIRDDQFVFEQKLDGHRVLLNVQGGIITAYGRNGQLSQHNPTMQQPEWRYNFAGLRERRLLIDGELIGDTYYAFDLPFLEGAVTQQDPHSKRKKVLDHLFRVAKFNPHLQLVVTARNKNEKATLVSNCLQYRAEGVMLKDTTAPYVEGRSNNMLKLKFTRDADAVVTRTNTNGKTNATLSVYNDDGEEIEIGRCSLIGKEDIETGDVVEVRYLYVSEKMRLVQPRIKHRREDKLPEECLISQFTPSDTKTVVAL